MEPGIERPRPEPKRRRRWVYVVLAVAILFAAYFWWENQQLMKDVLSESKVVVVVKSSTPSVTPTPSQIQTTSVITGSVGYPSSTAPVQTVCAVSTANPASRTCIDYPGSVAAGSLTYSMVINPGTYYVYASLKSPQGDFTTSYKAYYNKFVTCNKSGNCAAGLHGQNVAVVVGPGVTVGGVDPTDWYALGLSQ